MLLHEIWREAEQLERLRVCLFAKEVQYDDLEDPLPDGSLDHCTADFGRTHNWTPRLSEILCEPLHARTTFEIHKDGVGAASETAGGAAGKCITVSANVSMRVGECSGPRNFEDIFVAVCISYHFEGGFSVASHAVMVQGRPS